MIGRACWVGLVLALALAPAAARGAPPLDKSSSAAPRDAAAAKIYVDAGNQAYRAGRYDLAVRAYEEAFRLLPVSAITFSMAQAHRLRFYQDRDLEHLHRALELYRRYLDEAPRGNRRGHATLHIEAIEGILASSPAAPSPTPSAEPPRPQSPPLTELMVVSKTPHARARIDGGAFLEVPFDRSVAPGRRTVELEAPGFASARAEWIAVEGRLVVASMDLASLPAVIRVSAPVHATARIDGKPTEGSETSVRAGVHVVSVTSRGHRSVVRQVSVGRGERAAVDVPDLQLTDRRVAAIWTLAGAGALALAGGVTTGLALSAENRVREYDDGIGQRTYSDSERAERNSVLRARDRYRLASWLLFGGAAAAGVTGAALFWFDQPSSDSSTGGLQPSIALESAGVAWRTAF